MADRPAKKTDALYQAIMDKKTQVREPVYAQEAASRDTNDIGYSYVEVSLTDRRLVLIRAERLLWIPGLRSAAVQPDGVLIEEKKTGVSVGNMTADCWLSFTDDLGIYGDPGIKSQCDNRHRGGQLWQYGLCGFQLRYDRLDRHRRLYCTAGRGCTGTVSECRNRHAGGCL